ncbi:hypothetical protein SpCBS45565_g00475 [Spizellomyces sp. 'palustris']|nr:hypothetical protein SpCBS45565_g00475 [Spizellomyces sp. 'palustris']
MSKHRQQETKKYGNDWAFRYVYCNDLPDLPFQPKLLEYPFPPDRLYRYEPNSLSDKFFFEVCGPDNENGVPCAPLGMGFLEDSFRNPDAKLVPQQLDPEDEELLAKPNQQNTAKPKSKEISFANSPLFLRRTNVNMAGEAKTYGRVQMGIERQMGVSIMRDEKLAKHIHHTEEDKLKTIENTFEAVKKFSTDNLKHPDGKDVKAVEIFPIFPDFSGAWPDRVTLSVFDCDPLEKSATTRKKIEPGSDKALALEEAVLKPLQNPETQETVLGYYTPTEESISKIRAKRKREEEFGSDEEDEEEFDFRHVRDYHYDARTEHLRQLVLRFDNDNRGVFYKRMEGRVNLKRKRARGINEEEEEWERPTRLTLTRRPLTDDDRHKRKVVVKEDLGIDESVSTQSSQSTETRRADAPTRGDNGTSDIDSLAGDGEQR